MIRIAAGVCSRSTATRGVFCRGFASSTSGFLQLERCDSGVCIVKMNKKPVNTFDIAMMNEFASTIETLETDPGVSSLVLTSAFDGIFCAGLDLKYLHKPTEAEFTEFWSTFEGMWAKYYTTSLSTVALINGTSPALGAVLSLASDYRVMVNNEKYRFGLNETSLRMVPPLWLQAMTERTLGARGAEFHLQFSSMLSPKDAAKVGYVDELCGDVDAALQASVSKCIAMSKIPEGARSAYKMHLRQPVVEKSGPESVKMMADNILGDEFQTTIQNVLDQLMAKKK